MCKLTREEVEEKVMKKIKTMSGEQLATLAEDLHDDAYVNQHDGLYATKQEEMYEWKTTHK